MICESLILGAHLATWHFDQSKPVNQLNLGVYASCDDWLGGVYRNSQWHTSVYAARVWHVGPVDVATGIVSGYEGSRIRPALVPSVGLPFAHLRLSWLPPSRFSGEGGVHLSWEIQR